MYIFLENSSNSGKTVSGTRIFTNFNKLIEIDEKRRQEQLEKKGKSHRYLEFEMWHRFPYWNLYEINIDDNSRPKKPNAARREELEQEYKEALSKFRESIPITEEDDVIEMMN